MIDKDNITNSEIDEVNSKLLSFIGADDDSYFDGDDQESGEIPSMSNAGEFELLDDTYNDIDFSQFKGKTFKDKFSRIKKITSKKKPKKRIIRRKKPLVKAFAVNENTRITGGVKKLARVLVPRDKTVIVEGVDKFILGKNPKDDQIRNIGYYKGEKLQELVLTFNNNSAIDFNLELFNTSMPLDYLYSTSLNLNDKIQVAGGGFVSYSDVLFNLLANPALLVNAKFTFSGPTYLQNINQPLIFKNKAITGAEKVKPIQLGLQVDNMQVADNIVFFPVMDVLNRAFIPDGMDVIQYKVLAGNTVTFAFYFKQKSLKKMFFPEAKGSKGLL